VRLSLDLRAILALLSLMPLLLQYLVIALGGALGSMLRFGLGSLIDSTMPKTGYVFPWGTIIVNITGCFVIGFIYTISLGTGARLNLSPLTRNFIMIGILGGYTTFSSFSLQTLTLAQDGQWWPATANVLLSVVLCLVGVWLGSMLASSFNQMR
jgi:CrcB protein